MLVRIYWLMWILFALSAFVLLVVGAFSTEAVVVLGFFAFGLTFTGMMCVLPGLVGSHNEMQHVTRAAAVPKPNPERSMKPFPVLKSA